MYSHGSAAGWQFKVTDANGKEIEGSPFTTGEDGVIHTTNILPGTYTVEENSPRRQHLSAYGRESPDRDCHPG